MQHKNNLLELIKKEKKSLKINRTDSNLLIAQDLCQTCYKMLLIILLKEFVKLNVDTNTMIKNVKLAELDTTFASVALNIQTLKMIL